eukprot:2112421-Prymnesium_polylepis.1
MCSIGCWHIGRVVDAHAERSHGRGPLMGQPGNQTQASRLQLDVEIEWWTIERALDRLNTPRNVFGAMFTSPLMYRVMYAGFHKSNVPSYWRRAGHNSDSSEPNVERIRFGKAADAVLSNAFLTTFPQANPSALAARYGYMNMPDYFSQPTVVTRLGVKPLVPFLIRMTEGAGIRHRFGGQNGSPAPGANHSATITVGQSSTDESICQAATSDQVPQLPQLMALRTTTTTSTSFSPHLMRCINGSAVCSTEICRRDLRGGRRRCPQGRRRPYF